jgi:hypothetical protein
MIDQDIVAAYLNLEGFEVIEALLDLCGATVDVRALPILRRRLHEETVQSQQWQERGYLRLHEKSEQLVTSLNLLIARLEGNHDTCLEA